MGAQAVIRLDRGGDLGRVLRLGARVDILAPVAVRPAVERAFTHRGQVVRHQVGAQFVAFVDHGPELPGVRLDGQRRRVAQACCIRLVRASGGVDLPDHRAVDLHFHATLGDVAVGADAHVKLAAVGTHRQGFGPVVVDLCRQVGDLGGRASGLGLAVGVVEAHQRILVGHVELAVGKRQAVRRVEVFGEHRLEFIGAVTVGVTQQGQAVAALDLGVAFSLDQAGDHILGLELGRAAATAFGDEDVTVGQHQGLTRDREVSGNRRDAVALRHLGFLIAPGRGLGNLHARQQAALLFRQLGIGAAGLGLVAFTPAGGQQQGGAQQRQCARRFHLTPPARRPVQVAASVSSKTIADRIRPPGIDA